MMEAVWACEPPNADQDPPLSELNADCLYPWHRASRPREMK